jgi:glycosyltransferase involved in cell wall biosynthesis
MAEAAPKLIIQIPCWNEQDTLPVTLAALPRHIDGIGRVEVLIISDGSTDRTVEVARNLRVEHILDLRTHQGLAKAFTAGLLEAARLGADYVVNLDADNQYCAEDIPKLLAPLLAGTADIAVGERPIGQIPHFSPLKKRLQAFGSWTVRRLAGTRVRDIPSGFRAYNRRAMLRTFVFSDYTYTQESLIAARDAGLNVCGVPIRVNPGVMRPSRLARNLGHYIAASTGTILRFYLFYNPRGILLGAGGATGFAGLLLWARFMYYYAIGDGDGHVQSLILSVVLLTASMFLFTLAVFADIMRSQRVLLQEVLSVLREERFARERAKGSEHNP